MLLLVSARPMRRRGDGARCGSAAASEAHRGSESAAGNAPRWPEARWAPARAAASPPPGAAPPESAAWSPPPPAGGAELWQQPPQRGVNPVGLPRWAVAPHPWPRTAPGKRAARATMRLGSASALAAARERSAGGQVSRADERRRGGAARHEDDSHGVHIEARRLAFRHLLRRRQVQSPGPPKESAPWQRCPAPTRPPCRRSATPESPGIAQRISRGAASKTLGRRTSGAIQCGVPMNVLRLLIVRVSCAATPKSASFTSPCSFPKVNYCSRLRAAHAPVSRMLLHLMSRCTLFRLCR